MRLLFLPTIHLIMIDATEPELATHAMYHYPREPIYRVGVRYYCSSTAASRTQGRSGLVVECRTPKRDVTDFNPTTAMQ